MMSGLRFSRVIGPLAALLVVALEKVGINVEVGMMETVLDFFVIILLGVGILQNPKK